MVPRLSTTKVSGAPYTPQSTPARPSMSLTTSAYGSPKRRSQAAEASGLSFQARPTMGTTPDFARSSSTGCSTWQAAHHEPQMLSSQTLPA